MKPAPSRDGEAGNPRQPPSFHHQFAVSQKCAGFDHLVRSQRDNLFGEADFGIVPPQMRPEERLADRNQAVILT